MKKVLSIILAFAMVFCFAACKKTEEEGFSYSKGLDDNGFYKDFKATDYVTLPDFSTINVTTEEINDQIQELLNSKYYMNQVQNKNRVAVDEDTVGIDYVGYMDGVAFEGGTSTSTYDLTIGSGSFIPGFEEQLIGHYPGETFKIDVTFPDPYDNNPDLAGKPATFEITMQYVIDYEKATLTDAWVETNFKDNNGWSTVSELKKGLKEYAVEDYLYENSTFKDEMPEIVKTQYVERTRNEIEAYATSYGIDADTYVSYFYGSYGFTSLDSLMEYYESYSNTAAQSFVMYQAIAEKANITVSDADLDAYFTEKGYEDNKTEMIKTYGKPYMKSIILYNKAVDYVTNLR